MGGTVSASGVRPGYSFEIGIIAFDSYQGISSGHIGQSSDRAAFSSYVHGPWAEPGPDGSFTDSPYTYNLTWFKPGRMFDGLVRHPRRAELAAVTSVYPSPPARQGLKVEFARQAGVQDVSTIGFYLFVRHANDPDRVLHHGKRPVAVRGAPFRAGRR